MMVNLMKELRIVVCLRFSLFLPMLTNFPTTLVISVYFDFMDNI